MEERVSSFLSFICTINQRHGRTVNWINNFFRDFLRVFYKHVFRNDHIRRTGGQNQIIGMKKKSTFDLFTGTWRHPSTHDSPLLFDLMQLGLFPIIIHTAIPWISSDFCDFPSSLPDQLTCSINSQRLSDHYPIIAMKIHIHIHMGLRPVATRSPTGALWQLRREIFLYFLFSQVCCDSDDLPTAITLNSRIGSVCALWRYLPFSKLCRRFI